MIEVKLSTKHLSASTLSALEDGQPSFFPIAAKKRKSGWLFRIPESALHNDEYLSSRKDKKSSEPGIPNDVLAAAKYALSRGETTFLFSEDGKVVKGLNIYS